MSAASREGRGGEIGVPRAFAARSSILFSVLPGTIRTAGAAGWSERDPLIADLKGDFLGTWDTAAGAFDPVGVLLLALSRGDGNSSEDSGRVLADLVPEEGGGEASVGISAKEEKSRQKKYIYIYI